MRVYYFDDSGDRGGNPDKPWLVVAGFGTNADKIPEIAAKVRGAAQRYNLSLEYPAELKFYHVGKTGHDKKRGRRNWMVDAGMSDPKHRRALVRDCLRNGLQVDNLRVIVAAVDQRELKPGESAIVKAVGLLLDRVQMDSQDFGTHGMVMMDEENAEDTALREAMRSGSAMIKSYANVLDTIAFLPSEESPGIQLADLVAGGVSRYLNSGDPGYMRNIWPHMRHRNGQRKGYGLVTYPRKNSIVPPPPQTVPWPEYDRRVHEYELAATNQVVSWWPDGSPTLNWPVADSVPTI